MFEYAYDFMAIGAHSDDIEISCAGSIIKMINEGKKGVLVDLTIASAASRGTVEDRLREGQEAARRMGGIERINLGFPDAHLQNNEETQKALLLLIRKYRPKLLLTHPKYTPHPDHNTTHQLVLDAWFKAGLKALYPESKEFRPHRVFFFHALSLVTNPDFAIDITHEYKQKKDVISAFQSQFSETNVEGNVGVAPLSKKNLEKLEAIHLEMGRKINKKYAEGFSCWELPEVRSLTDLEGESH